jgi:hypothetical protein
MVGEGSQRIGRDEPRRKQIGPLFVFGREWHCMLTTSTSSSAHPSGAGADSTARREIRRRVAAKNRPSADGSRRSEVEREVSGVWRGRLLPREEGEGAATVNPCIWREREECREEGERVALAAAGECSPYPMNSNSVGEGKGDALQSVLCTPLSLSLPLVGGPHLLVCFFLPPFPFLGRRCSLSCTDIHSLPSAHLSTLVSSRVVLLHLKIVAISSTECPNCRSTNAVNSPAPTIVVNPKAPPTPS